MNIERTRYAALLRLIVYQRFHVFNGRSDDNKTIPTHAQRGLGYKKALHQTSMQGFGHCCCE
jgi:hypothetical protein